MRIIVGDTRLFSIADSVHQASAMSPFLSIVFLDVISGENHEQYPGLMMYADDIALTDEDKQKLKQKVNQWNGTLKNDVLTVTL